MEKDKGKPNINRLRITHLVETDFNFISTLIWGKAFMKHNEVNDNFHRNQYGGREGIQGQSAALNKNQHLTHQIIIKKKNRW